jgi:hypothetical protein
MPQLTPSQARVVNPVLTTIAQGIKQRDLVGSWLFPKVDVALRGGQIITFGREAFMQYTGLQRAPGTATSRVQFGYAAGSYTLLDFSLEGKLPVELEQEGRVAANGFSIDGAEMALKLPSRIMDLRLEIAQATLATTLANYPPANRITLSGTSQFSDYSNSNPLTAFETGKEAVRAQTGQHPTHGIMGPAVWASLKYHPDLAEYTKYTGREVATLSILSDLTGIPNWYVGNCITSNDAGTTLSDVWGKDIVLAYSDTETLDAYGAPTFGYTYNLSGYPFAEDPYYDRNQKSQIFPVTRCEAPVIAGSSAGYLIKSAVA